MIRTTTTFAVLLAATALQAQVCSVTITHEVNGDQVQFHGISPDAPTQWSWFFNGGTPMTSNLQDPVVTFAEPGEHIVALTVSGGPNSCSASLSSDVDTVVTLSTGIHERTSSGLRITFASAQRLELVNDGARRSSIVLYDATGRTLGTLFQGELQTGRTSFDLSAFPLRAGVHFITITSDNGTLVRKFVVE